MCRQRPVAEQGAHLDRRLPRRYRLLGQGLQESGDLVDQSAAHRAKLLRLQVMGRPAISEV